MTLTERLSNLHRRESGKAKEEDEHAERALDREAAVVREHAGPGATREWIRGEQHRHRQEAKEHQHRARVHRRRAALAGPNGEGDLLQSPDEVADSDFMTEHGGLVAEAHRQGRVHHAERLPRSED
jgi:hypothetical protein